MILGLSIGGIRRTGLECTEVPKSGTVACSGRLGGEVWNWKEITKSGWAEVCQFYPRASTFRSPTNIVVGLEGVSDDRVNRAYPVQSQVRPSERDTCL